MYKTQGDALAFLQEFLSHLTETPDDREAVLCVPFTALGTLSKNLHGSRVKLGAQNIHWEDEGAYTGEISGSMLEELGVRYVIVGHSERRQYFGETDETVNRRLLAAQRYGLTPILCVGETKQQRDAGETDSVIAAQISKDLIDVDQSNLVIAYEPIWAIGTGKSATPEQAQEVHAHIRDVMARFGDSTALRILYGGSVNAQNAAALLGMDDIDGALVGGASLDPEQFLQLAGCG